jgi:hypothetical protein
MGCEEDCVMESDGPTIYGVGSGSLIGSAIGYLVGLLVITAGFIFASRYLIGKRVERFERDWRTSHGSNDEDDQKPPPPDESKPPSGW